MPANGKWDFFSAFKGLMFSVSAPPVQKYRSSPWLSFLFARHQFVHIQVNSVHSCSVALQLLNA
jgi:hypothetical protein